MGNFRERGNGWFYNPVGRFYQRLLGRLDALAILQVETSIHCFEDGPMSQDTEFPETLPQSAEGFAQQQFRYADVGHASRKHALLRAAKQICRHPGGTLPNKFANPTDYKSMDYLMNRPEVTHASVLGSHLQVTRETMQAHDGPLLVIHDTTGLDYTGLSIPELGQIGNGGGRGYLCHNSLVVDPSNHEVIGLAHQILHRRPPAKKLKKGEKKKPEGVKARRERPTRESRLWSDAVRALGAVPEGKKWIDVADRGADIFEFLATEQKLGRSCVVRACYDRVIQTGHDGRGKRKKLFGYLRSLPASGTKSKTVFDKGCKTERPATLSLAYAPVLVQPPHVKKGEYENKPIVAWGVRIWGVRSLWCA